MAISGDYSHPVTVNGFSCRNCTDVDRAKRFIDPADPKSGPFGVNATSGGKAHAQLFDADAIDRATPADRADERRRSHPIRAYATTETPGTRIDLVA
jgi:hypothetical protein